MSVAGRRSAPGTGSRRPVQTEEGVMDRVFTIPVLIPFRFHFGSGSKIFGYSSPFDSILTE